MSLSELQTYHFELFEILKSNNPDHHFKAIHVYKFMVDGKYYLATFEEYLHHVYILQFCLEENKEMPDKFNQLANVGPIKAKNIIATCVHIGLSIYDKDPLASFFFTASTTGNELVNSNPVRNKRLSVYKYFAEFFFDSRKFTHLSFLDKNSYLILNKSSEQKEVDIIQKMEEILNIN